MKLLILGGTIFLGRHVVDAALARGHQVTLFHRGQHGPDLFPGVERLTGDRDAGPGELGAAFRGRRWDAVVDTSAYFPDMVEASAGLLAGAADRYCFISSVSVYGDFSKPGLDESAPVTRLTADQLARAREIRAAGPVRAAALGELYGGLKALCEEAAEAALPGRTLNIRPGLIVGPHDYSNRFTYWVRRVADGGEVLAPGEAARPVQFIDARDLAEWIVRLLEDGQTGVFNATGPATPLSFGALLDACRAAAASEPAFTWVSDEFLSNSGVGAWIELPLWTGADPSLAGFMSVDCARARAAGLTFRPVVETARDTLSWDLAMPADSERKAGLARERERGLLAAWKER
ncbi:MAG: NAD-dependent epimerase/dehydratase family protein [Candidatus Eisenbacteria bacterium]|nr:NAD-dependent epimerase/dehydratase family protein [Candidatus Eisenbacteria bacterium]